MNDIEQRAKTAPFRSNVRPLSVTTAHAVGYIQGATEQREIDIEKAKEWLKKNVNNYLYNTGGCDEYIPKCGDKMFTDFEKAMMEK